MRPIDGDGQGYDLMSLAWLFDLDKNQPHRALAAAGRLIAELLASYWRLG